MGKAEVEFVFSNSLFFVYMINETMMEKLNKYKERKTNTRFD